MNKQFSVGQTVQWTSSASGSTKTKRGTVVAVVPADKRGLRVRDLLGDELLGYSINGLDCILYRKHESYVVAVTDKPGCMPRLYWPRTSALQASAAREGGNE